MKRIDTANREVDKFGAGKDGFRASVPGVSDPTYLSAAWCEAIQESVVRVIEHSGLVPDANHDQLITALQTMNLSDYAALRNFGGLWKNIYVTGYLVSAAASGVAGMFVRDDSDTTSADNGGTIIVAANGKRWKRAFTGAANAQWFGAKGDGIFRDGALNDRACIQAAMNAHDAVYIPGTADLYAMDDQIQPNSNQLVYGDNLATHLQVPDGTVNVICGAGANNVTVRNLRASTRLQINATVYKGAVVASNCTNWLIENVFATGMGYWGIGLQDSSNCKVTGCRFYAGFGALQDSANIALLNNCHFNDIESNYCYNTATWHGILMQDTYSGAQPVGNRIVKNFIDGQLADGISVYTPTAYNTRTLIDGNDVRNIQGTALGGLSGHGIYIQSAGGTRAVNNTIVNCARLTTDFDTQVVAGIGVAIGEYATGILTVVDVSHNHVVMNRGPCIAAATSAVPVNITHNYAKQAGTEAVRSECIRTINVRRAHVAHNIVEQLNPNYQSIGMIAGGQTIDGGTLAHNEITTVKYGIQVGGIGGGAFSALNYGDNRVSGGDDQATSVSEVTNLRFHSNSLKSTGIVGVFNNCPGSRFTGNIFDSQYAPYGLIFTGVMTGSVCDESNILPARVENDGGMIIVRYGNATVGAGNISAVGDRVIQSVPAVGSPKGWGCTVAGNPGTWISEGNF